MNDPTAIKEKYRDSSTPDDDGVQLDLELECACGSGRRAKNCCPGFLNTDDGQDDEKLSDDERECACGSGRWAIFCHQIALTSNDKLDEERLCCVCEGKAADCMERWERNDYYAL